MKYTKYSYMKLLLQGIIENLKLISNRDKTVTRGMDPGMLAAGRLQQECIGMPTLQYLEVIRPSTECIDA